VTRAKRKLLRGYPIGSLVTWRGDTVSAVCFGIVLGIVEALPPGKGLLIKVYGNDGFKLLFPGSLKRISKLWGVAS
jgi:hypothetical protein